MRTLALVSIVMFLAVPAFADAPAPITLTLDDMVDQPVASVEWGIETTPLATDTGEGAGKVTFQELTITKQVDKSSSKLFNFCTKGTHIPEARLMCRKAGKGQQDYFVIVLKDVVITKDKVSSKGDAPVETISFSYSKVEVQYPTQ